MCHNMPMQLLPHTWSGRRFMKVLGVALFLITGIAAAATISFSHLLIHLNDTESTSTPSLAPTPFPLGVDPHSRTITQLDNVESFLTSQLASSVRREHRRGWLATIERILLRSSAVQQLASASTRTLVIWPGDRKEQVVDHFGNILNWNDTERNAFAEQAGSTAPTIADGMLMPGRYILPKDTGPDVAAAAVTERFENEVLSRYPAETEAVLPLKDTLIIASLLEREAYSFDHMQEISGVIWNRLFADMPLQLDATLQYAKGSEPTTPVWWPLVEPQDKYIDSPFNTYQVGGLPPEPIANPSAAAILAAMNPNLTDCMFYFHHDDGELHCSATYDEHVAKLQQLYGRGS